jgi:glutamate-5-semialdehyde dehydrogenase
MDLHAQIVEIGEKAVKASRALAALKTRKKNTILQAMADSLETEKARLLQANARDMAEGENAGLGAAMLDRLRLNEARIQAMARALRDISALKDPIGGQISRWIRPNGLEIVKRRVPIGVIAIIYESRPNVTADAAALCFKTSNAVILRGGKEAIQSNRAIAAALIEGGRRKGLPEHAIQLIETTDREAVRHLLQLENLVDLAIPRGGETLIRAVTEMSRVPVLKHYKGVCHTYVDEAADLDMALAIVENAKCQRPGVCNAMETMLVHEAVAAEFLPKAALRFAERGVELRGDPAACALVPDMREASESDWSTEYLDLVLSVKIVPSVAAAVEHINRYGSRHSDAIVTESESAGRIFTHDVDSATVYVNASTRFTDGGEFGMGAEMGISTDKLHARGPVGLEELTTYKYIVGGNGQIRT